MAEADALQRPTGVDLLHYRPWRGSLAGGGEWGVLAFLGVQLTLLVVMGVVTSSVARLILSALYLGLWGMVVYARAWPIARASIELLVRRWLFWVIYVVTALPAFLFFFFTLYLFVWAEDQMGSEVRMGGLGRVNPQFLVKALSEGLKMNGSAETYRNFISYESWPVMIMLALAGALLVGNDVRHNSLAFYLSKPISRWDYVIGKGIAVAFVVNVITTVPALILWLEYGFIKQEDYFLDQLVAKSDLLVGILTYGAVLTVSLTAMLLATATWLRRTVPLIMTWTILFIFCGALGGALTNLGWGRHWRLLDLWNCTYVVGNALLGIESSKIQPQPQPEWYYAALVLTGVVIACLSYLILRIRGVEVVK